MSYQAGLRALRSGQPLRSIFRQTFQRRWQSTTAEATVPPVKPQSQNPFSWNSPVGPKTVHFWAPVMKVIHHPPPKQAWFQAAPFRYPPQDDFIPESDNIVSGYSLVGALMATGAIWTRWCLIIKPKNYLLAAVNFFLFIANGCQVARIVSYQRSQKNITVGEEVKGAAKDVKAAATDVVASK